MKNRLKEFGIFFAKFLICTLFVLGVGYSTMSIDKDGITFTPTGARINFGGNYLEDAPDNWIVGKYGKFRDIWHVTTDSLFAGGVQMRSGNLYVPDSLSGGGWIIYSANAYNITSLNFSDAQVNLTYNSHNLEYAVGDIYAHIVKVGGNAILVVDSNKATINGQLIVNDSAYIGGVYLNNGSVVASNGIIFNDPNNYIWANSHNTEYNTGVGYSHQFYVDATNILNINSNGLMPNADAIRKLGAYDLNFDSAFALNLSTNSISSNTGTLNIEGDDIEVMGNTVFTGGLAYADSLHIYDKIESDATFYIYFGEEFVDGSWRIGRSGNNLIIQRRESASWVTKQTYTP